MKQVGSLVELARRGQPVPDRHENPYVHQAIEASDWLFTPDQLEEFDHHAAFSPSDSGEPRFFVEVGTYMGKNLMEMALDFPQDRFLGLEITYKRSVKTAKRICRAGCANARVGICDARALFASVKPASVAGVCVFFPDPWPKKRHAKNRLVRDPFLRSLESSLIPGGFLWLKTDSWSYYEEALSDAAARGWAQSEGLTPVEFSGKDYQTVFEQMFARKGEPTYSAVLRPPQFASELQR